MRREVRSNYMRQRDGYGMRLRSVVGERKDRETISRERKGVKGMNGKRLEKKKLGPFSSSLHFPQSPSYF